jgi:glycosyltransferase involved in cell wall biosynthesis
VYNNADFVQEALTSVLAQTYTDLEVVVADHESTDGTWELLQPFADDPRVRLLRTPAGGGAKRNWDRVSQAATGDLVKLVCGDDLLYPTNVEREVAALEAAGESAVLAASTRDLVDARGDVFLRGRGLQGLTGRVEGEQAVRQIVRSGTNPLGEPACVLMRRDALERAGWWHDAHPFYIDVATYVRVLLRGDLVTVDEPLAAFRLSETQWSVSLTAEQYRQAAGFAAAVHELAPEVVTAADVRLGNARARLTAPQRRLAYLWLGRRMRAG